MARKSKKKKTIRPEDLLAGRASATARELIRLIHRINPTKAGVEPQKAAHRYRLKARLQSLLIRRFGEGLIVEQPDVNQPQLIGIRLRNFDEDACHALIHELDEDARSWAQRQIDESQLDHSQDSFGAGVSPKVDSPAPSSQNGPMEAEQSADELLQLGRKALEEFDYERSKELYCRALQRSEGDLQPAQALLEILIEHLAADEEALALSESFSASTLKDKEVRIRLATAYARLDRIESALATIQRIVEPEAALVYYLAAKHFIARHDEDQALNQVASLKACGSLELVLETEQLEKEIRALQAKRLEPLEAQMLRSQQAGKVEKASELAHQLLSLMPENKAARKILRDIEKKKRQNQIEILLQRAGEARDRRDFEQEADFLARILTMGKKTPRLKRLLAEAQQQALQQRQKAEADELVSYWSAGVREKALLGYTQLGASQRERIRARIHNFHFKWMETALAASGTNKPLKLVRAVLALGQCTEALDAGEDPRQVIDQLRLCRKTLQCLPQAQEILIQAETRIRNLEEKEKQKLLAEAEAFVDAGDFSMAGELIEKMKGFNLDETDRKRLEPLKRHFFHFQKIQRLGRRYRESVSREDEFTSRRLAGRLARLLEDGSARRWADKVTRHTSAIRTKWCLSTAELSGLPGCYGALGLNTYSGDTSCLLLPGGRQLLIATAHDRWVFLRTYDLSNRRFNRGYLLQAPRALEFAKASIDGDTVWINDLKGQVFQVGLNPFDVLFWHDFGALIAGEAEYEDAIMCPQSRILWLKKSGPTENRDDVFEIVHIDRARSIRRIRSSGFPDRIYVGGKYQTVLQDLLGGSVRICTDDGKVLETFKLETIGTFHHAAVHPNGTEYIFLPFDDTGAMERLINSDSQMKGDLMLVLEVKPDPEKKYKPIKITNSDGEADHGIATSLDHGIVFAHFFQDSGNRFGRRLTAWKPTTNGLEMIFSRQAPENLMLACDETFRQVAAVAFSPFELEACLLDERPPEFSASLEDLPPALHTPPFEGPWLCSSPTGKINATSMAFMLQLQNADFRETRRMMREMKKNAPADHVAALVGALERILRLEEAGKLKRFMREKYPDHYLVRIELADEALQKSDWPGVIDLLQGLTRESLDDGSARHLCHLLGMAYFSIGEVQKALGAWKEGLAYENGRCELEPYINYAEIALRSPKSRKKSKTESAASKVLSIFEQVDQHLADRQWEPAIAAVESFYPLTNADRQMLARLAHAYLQLDFIPGEMRWVCKVLALANFLDCFKVAFKKDPVLPPSIEKWPESRLAEVARCAEHWFAMRARYTRQEVQDKPAGDDLFI
ncbi:MAG: hypothetical protein PVH37_08110 [Desulfobacterales bacterium]|jgi:hypothetical protein